MIDLLDQYRTQGRQAVQRTLLEEPEAKDDPEGQEDGQDAEKPAQKAKNGRDKSEPKNDRPKRLKDLPKREKKQKPLPKPKGISSHVWNLVSTDTKPVLMALAAAAREHSTVRIRYVPKVTKWPKHVAVYRTVEPYSIRVRRIHVNGYDNPPKPTVVFFGYDKFDEDGETIKMFVLDRIITVTYKGRKFSPRWAVEFESKDPNLERFIDETINQGLHLVELTTSGMVGAYDVPLGSKPINQRRKRRKKRKP